MGQFAAAVRGLGGAPASLGAGDLDRDFSHWGTDRTGSLTEGGFVAYCTAKLGSSRRVAVKFMAETEQWARGRDVRRDARPEGRFVLGLLPPPPDAVLSRPWPSTSWATAAR